MRILINAVSRDTQPTGISRVAASHIKALLEHSPRAGIILAVGRWQEQLFQSLLGRSWSHLQIALCKFRNNSFARNLWHTFTLPRVAAHYDADIVHLSYPVPLARWFVSAPVVLTLHDLYPYDIPENFGFPRYLGNRAILRLCLSSVDAIACVSRTTLRRLIEFAPNIVSKVPTAVTGNYVEEWSGESQAPGCMKPPRQPFILSIGQHRKNKNLAFLIHAYAALVEARRFSGELVIVGTTGPETHHLRSMAAVLRGQMRVIFMQQISDAELTWLYRHCACFVAASSVEGYCLPLAEARLNRARIVCSDIPIFRELGGAQSRFFSLTPDPVCNLTSALTETLDASSHQQPDEFHPSTIDVLDEYLKLYRRVRSDRGGGVQQNVALLAGKQPATIQIDPRSRDNGHKHTRDSR